MKSRKDGPEPDPPPASWRWAIGGPITDFGEDGIQAGPSRVRWTPRPPPPLQRRRGSVLLRRDDDEDADDDENAGRDDDQGVADVDTCVGRRRSSSLSQSCRHPSSLSSRRSRLAAFTLALALAPLSQAGPLPPPKTTTPLPTTPTRTLPPETTPTDTPPELATQTISDIQPRRLNSEAPYVYPSVLPDIPVTYVPSTVLPLYFSKLDDGKWHHVHDAWSMYGVVATDKRSPSEPTSFSVDPEGSTKLATASFHVESSLPNGWGQSSPRSSFYKTPLIVAASVILAILFVVGIITYALQRRKNARRKRRQAARLRRKALAAAGMTEDELKTGGETADRLFKQHLDELEQVYRAKRKTKRTTQPTFVRTKVRVYMRRRKQHAVPTNQRTNRDSPNKEEQSAFTSAHVLQRQESRETMSTDASSYISSGQSRPSSSFSTHPRSSSSPPTAPTSDPATSQTITSECPLSPVSSSQQDSSEAAGSSGAGDPSGSGNEATSSSAAAGPSTAPSHMPPAYRPASVRSVDVGSSSSRPAPPPTHTNLREKVAASGFYPAPATEDAEIAQAVAHRADAKAPIVVPPEQEEQRARHHVATDDKRELERLRLGASAPPVARADDESDAGPSAPQFAIDDSGFEVVTEGLDESSDAGHTPATTAPTTPGIPAPPTRPVIRSLATFAANEASDETHLLPSAPPMSPLSDRDRVPSAPPLHPSAPPLDDGHDAASMASAPAAPSAPPLNDDDDESLYVPAPSAPALDVDSDAHDDAHDIEAASDDGTGANVRASLAVNGHRFLPRYEP